MPKTMECCGKKPKSKVEGLVEALEYIVDKPQIARNVNESWKWINEFEDVAKQALERFKEE